MKITLEQLTTKATFPHQVKAQCGLTVDHISSNLEFVAKNVGNALQGIDFKVTVNSGFRPYKAGSTSQHCLGEAIDLQITGVEPGSWRQYELSKKLADILWSNQQLRPHINQLILEKIKGFVVHLGVKINPAQAKGQRFTLVYSSSGKGGSRAIRGDDFASFQDIISTQQEIG